MEVNITVLSDIHAEYPTKELYFTEQWTSSEGIFQDDLIWSVVNVVIGSVNNWSLTALEWNLANTPRYTPHTTGGCDMCKGALNIDTSTQIITRNVAYYIIAHASKFIYPKSTRLHSELLHGTPTCALKFTAFQVYNQSYSNVLLVVNEGNSDCEYNIEYSDSYLTTTIPANSVITYTIM